MNNNNKNQCSDCIMRLARLETAKELYDIKKEELGFLKLNAIKGIPAILNPNLTGIINNITAINNNSYNKLKDQLSCYTDRVFEQSDAQDINELIDTYASADLKKKIAFKTKAVQDLQVTIAFNMGKIFSCQHPSHCSKKIKKSSNVKRPVRRKLF